MRNITPAWGAMSKLLRGHFVLRKFLFRFCDAVRRKQVPRYRCPVLIDRAKYDADYFEATSINFIGGLTVEPKPNTHNDLPCLKCFSRWAMSYVWHAPWLPQSQGRDPLVTNIAARDDEAAFQAMRQHFSEQQIVELTVFCGMWKYSNRLCEALHIDLERLDNRIEFQDG